jgi:hypothetical protein
MTCTHCFEYWVGGIGMQRKSPRNRRNLAVSEFRAATCRSFHILSEGSWPSILRGTLLLWVCMSRPRIWSSVTSPWVSFAFSFHECQFGLHYAVFRRRMHPAGECGPPTYTLMTERLIGGICFDSKQSSKPGGFSKESVF